MAKIKEKVSLLEEKFESKFEQISVRMQNCEDLEKARFRHILNNFAERRRQLDLGFQTMMGNFKEIRFIIAQNSLKFG